MLRTGAPWRDVPSEYGDGKKTHRRFCRWRNKRIGEKILEALLDEPDFEWLLIDASHFECYALGHHGGMYRKNASMGRRRIVVFVVGAISEFVKIYSKPYSMNLISNGL